MSRTIKMGVFALGALASVGVIAETNETDTAVATEKVLEAAAEVPVTNEERPLPNLTGLFGVKFGATLPAGQGASTNENVVAARFSLPSKKSFLGFTDFVKLATPETRQIFLVRATRTVMPGEAEEVMAKAIRLIEFRFNLRAVAKDAHSQAIFFADKDVILISQREDRIFIEAINDKLLTLARDESNHAAVTRFKDDLAALKVVMAVESLGEESKPARVDSVFGRTFGEPLVEKSNVQTLPDGSACVDFGITGFLGCTRCTVYASARTKGIYRVRAYWPACSDKTRFSDIRRVVEIAMKTSMTEGGKDKNACRLEFENLFVTLVRDEVGNIALDFTDKVVYAKHQDEAASLTDRAEWRDVESL